MFCITFSTERNHPTNFEFIEIDDVSHNYNYSTVFNVSYSAEVTV